MNKIQLHLYMENRCKNCEYYNKKALRNNPVCKNWDNLHATDQTYFMYLDHIPHYRPNDPYPQELCYERNSKISGNRKTL